MASKKPARKGPTRASKIEAAAHAVVDAYISRFESGHPPGVFGPIDTEIMALKAELKK